MTWLNVTEYLCHRWPPIFNKSNTTVLLVEQELLTPLAYPSSPSFLVGLVVFSAWFGIFVCRFFFLLAIAIYVLLQLIGPDYPFGIFFLTTI